jgi:hypothetical protein
MRKIKDLNKLTLEGMEPWRGYLSDKKIKLLEKSWAGTFRNSILPALPVNTLAKNYIEDQGRPTKDLLTAMGAAILQQVFNLTDEETRQELAFNQMWHYALETYDPKEQLFAERTLWTVRHHLTQTGSAQVVFNTITDHLAEIFNVDTSNQRLDSVHVYSNMANLGRARLMARTITKFLRNLKRHFSGLFNADISAELKSRYLKEESSSYFGNTKPSESQRRLSEIAEDMQYLIEKYSGSEEVRKMNSYKLLERVISEQCEIVDDIMKVKVAKEISSDSLQNPSDVDAGYDGHKGQGYQVQISETYTSKDENEEVDNSDQLNLITYVKVESADNHDSNALMPAIDEMEERGIKPEEMLADAAYGGDDNVRAAEDKGVSVVSPVSGRKSDKDFTGFEFDEGTSEVTKCPNGKQPASVKNNKKGTITARWAKVDCESCPVKEYCQTKKGARGRRLNYSKKDIRLWQRRRNEAGKEFRDKYRYRAGIEATNARFIHMTGARRVRYRGIKNVEFAETMKALGINMFRVQKHTQKSGNFRPQNPIIFIYYLIFGLLCVIRRFFGLKIEYIVENQSSNCNFRNFAYI